MTPEIKTACLDNVFIKLMYFSNKNQKQKITKQKYNSLLLLSCGSIEVEVNKSKTTFSAPHIIYVTENKQHNITSLEDDTVVHSINFLRDDQGNVLDPSMIPNGVDISKFGIEKELL